MLARGMQREATPTAADVEHALPRGERELLANELELGPLRLPERLRPPGPNRARVGHRLAEHQLEELVGYVVVVPDRALVTGAAVPPAARPELRPGGAWQRPQSARAHGRCDKSRLQAWIERCDLVAVEQLERRIHIVDLDLAGNVGAAEPELPRGSEHVREGAGRAHAEGRPAGAVGRRQAAAVPQRDRERALGKRLCERFPEFEGGVRAAQATGSATSFSAWRCGVILTTSHASPARSKPRITSADMSSSQRRMPW